MAKASEALTHGYTMAFAGAGVLFLVGAAVTALAVTSGKQRHAQGAAPVHMG